MTLLLTLKVAKYLSLSLFAAGVWSALGAGSTSERLRAAYAVVTPAFVLLWVVGYAMMKLLGHRISAEWIVATLLASVLAFVTTIVGAARTNLRAPRVLAAAGITASLAFMVTRGAVPWTVPVVVGALVGSAFALLPARGAEPPPADPSATVEWFRWVARAEGSSLILMVLVNMPMRATTGLSLDGGNGLLGWTHGVFVVIYIVSLAVTSRAAGWRASTAALAFVASLVPFGTFWFERRRL